MAHDGTVFYVNAHAEGPGILSDVMKWHWKKKANLTERDERAEKRGLMTSFMNSAGNMMGSLQSATTSSTSTADHFGDLVIEATRKGMARLGYYCDCEKAFVDGRNDKVFAAVLVTNVRQDASQVSPCKITLPACLFKCCFCCPRAHFHTSCDKYCCCVLPLNIEAVAAAVEDLLENDKDIPVHLNTHVEAETPHHEHLFLEQHGFHDVPLPDHEHSEEEHH